MRDANWRFSPSSCAVNLASLASDIAERLGADPRGEDLIAAAGLGAHGRTTASGDRSRRKALTQSRRPTAD